MANVRQLIPLILKWEAGVAPQATIEAQWENARKRGFSNDPDDSGGATMCGITLNTFARYRALKGLSRPSIDTLKNISLNDWTAILKTFYWDKMKADQINNQSIANLCTQMCWGSGTITAIKKIQNCLGTTADGVVGPKTLALLNNGDQRATFNKLWNMRKVWLTNIATKGNNQKFLKGWLNRLNDYKFSY